MRSIRFSALWGATVLGLALSMSSAQAGTILVFGQTGTANLFIASNPTSTTTKLSAVDIPVMITAIDNANPLGPGFPGAFFSMTATNSSALSGSGAGPFSQTFGGTFDIWSGAGKTGTDYLTGTFAGATLFGSGSGLVLTVSGAGIDPLTSSVITSLDPARAISLSFTNVTPPAHNAGSSPDTFGAFSSNVSGTFSAQPDPNPEPTSIALLGIGMTSFLVFRRLFKRA